MYYITIGITAGDIVKALSKTTIKDILICEKQPNFSFKYIENADQ